jgi:hypothetical protein
MVFLPLRDLVAFCGVAGVFQLHTTVHALPSVAAALDADQNHQTSHSATNSGNLISSKLNTQNQLITQNGNQNPLSQKTTTSKSSTNSGDPTVTPNVTPTDTPIPTEYQAAALARQLLKKMPTATVMLAPKWALRNLGRILGEFHENFIETICVSDN